MPRQLSAMVPPDCVGAIAVAWPTESARPPRMQILCATRAHCRRRLPLLRHSRRLRGLPATVLQGWLDQKTARTGVIMDKRSFRFRVCEIKLKSVRAILTGYACYDLLSPSPRRNALAGSSLQLVNGANQSAFSKAVPARFLRRYTRRACNSPHTREQAFSDRSRRCAVP